MLRCQAGLWAARLGCSGIAAAVVDRLQVLVRCGGTVHVGSGKQLYNWMEAHTMYQPGNDLNPALRDDYVPFDPEYLEVPESWTRDDFTDLLPVPGREQELLQ